MYCFINTRQAEWLLRKAVEDLGRRYEPKLSSAIATAFGAIEARSNEDEELPEPYTFNRLLTWSDTPQGYDWWRTIDFQLERWGESFDSMEASLACINSAIGTSPTPEPVFEEPTSGFSKWIYETCLAQTENFRICRGESSLTKEESRLLRRMLQMDSELAVAFVEYQRSIGVWRGTPKDVHRIIRGTSSGYLPLQMVVPLEAGTGNGHNYPVGKPALMLQGKSGIRIGSLGKGNSLCDNTPEYVRPATLEEIQYFFAKTNRERYMSYLESVLLPSLKDEYPTPEIPL